MTDTVSGKHETYENDYNAATGNVSSQRMVNGFKVCRATAPARRSP